MASVQQLNQHVAYQLRKRRQALGWSLSRTAEATGVSKAMLGQIERQESSPTIATLWKLATGLACSFSSLLQPARQAEVTETLAPLMAQDPHMQVTTLFAFNPATGMEAFEIVLSNQHTQQSAAHAQGVLEHIHVLSGELGVYEQGQWRQLAAGEQTVLAADAEHGYRDNTGHTRFIDIICYP